MGIFKLVGIKNKKKMKLSEQINTLEIKRNSLKDNYEQRVQELMEVIEELLKPIDLIEKKWKGSWFKNEDCYQDFIGNKEDIVIVTYDVMKSYIEKRTNLIYRIFCTEVSDILKKFKDYNDSLVIELSIIKQNEKFVEQIKILEKLENFEWGYPASKFVKIREPKKFMVDDRLAQKIMNEGFTVPPHISFVASLSSKASELFSIQDHIKLSYRLLRELELSIGIGRSGFDGNNNPLTTLDRLFERFHDVARQLLNRHAKRETLKITDEYDVQDLLHALLKIDFDDVRPEDFTPSYAGRNTRIDFLLKKERIVIEVKKTRSTLKDREIGDELLQDIARYKNHPNCDILYCFVYDPKGLIANPIGLENDLSSESNESLQVFVKIKP